MLSHKMTFVPHRSWQRGTVDLNRRVSCSERDLLAEEILRFDNYNLSRSANVGRNAEVSVDVGDI